MAPMLVGPKGRKPQIELTWVVVAGSWHRMVLPWVWTEISAVRKLAEAHHSLQG